MTGALALFFGLALRALCARRAFTFLPAVYDFFMRWIVGIDEVGRGALAGPVVVVAAAIPTPWRLVSKKARALGALKDSKKLTPLRRDAWFIYFIEHQKIHFAIARVYPRGIERLNISRAANVAAHRAHARLVRAIHPDAQTKIFLDGGLFLGNGQKSNSKNVKTVIKGDEKIRAVAIASIIAKVHRDRYMVRLAKKFPAYGFAIHKGYGTKLHRKALKNFGPSVVHRLTFIS